LPCITELRYGVALPPYIKRVKKIPALEYYITLMRPPQGEITKTGIHARLSVQSVAGVDNPKEKSKRKICGWYVF
jgi:hypothetical protein